MPDHPMIRCRPTESDAELQAQRDAKHLQEVREAMEADHRQSYALGWHAAIAMVHSVIAEMLDDIPADDPAADMAFRNTRTGRRVALTVADSRIALRAREVAL